MNLPFAVVSGIAIPLDPVNVNTDQIVPSRFLLKARGHNHAEFLFHDLRFGPEASPSFPFNNPVYAAAKIVVANRNFGCGSSREQAAFALVDYGIRAVIAPSFGDIFRNNCVKNSILPAIVSDDCAEMLRRELQESPGAGIEVDIVKRTIRHPCGAYSYFEIDNQDRDLLISGDDPIARSMKMEAEIAAFEAAYFARTSWLFPTEH